MSDPHLPLASLSRQGRRQEGPAHSSWARSSVEGWLCVPRVGLCPLPRLQSGRWESETSTGARQADAVRAGAAGRVLFSVPTAPCLEKPCCLGLSCWASGHSSTPKGKQKGRSAQSRRNRCGLHPRLGLREGREYGMRISLTAGSISPGMCWDPLVTGEKGSSRVVRGARATLSPPVKPGPVSGRAFPRHLLPEPSGAAQPHASRPSPPELFPCRPLSA